MFGYLLSAVPMVCGIIGFIYFKVCTNVSENLSLSLSVLIGAITALTAIIYLAYRQNPYPKFITKFKDNIN